MNKNIKIPKIKRNCLTQQAQTYYPQHLVLRKKRIFEKFIKNPQQSTIQVKSNFNQETNFGFNITNEYVFVLLHLKSKDNKNILNINIPQVCIFVDKNSYDIIYNDKGFIRSFKNHQSMKCRLRDMQIIFKQNWKNKFIPKNEHVNAVFKERQVLILSQTDFIIVCKKIKTDPFFKKLQYIQNKLPYVGQQIVVQYDSCLKQQKMIKLVTQSLLGFKNQQQILKQLGQEKYLHFLNEKISMTLNYQHNIRIVKANFHYVKNQKGQYFFVNVTNLSLVNLTKALKSRQQKMKQKQQQRNKLLHLSPEKQKLYKKYQKPNQIKKIQTLMKENFEFIVKKANLLSIDEAKNQQIKNQIAFKRLHPQINKNYRQFISSTDFKKTKQKLFGSTFSNRKPISIPSKYIQRSYNRMKRSYTLQNGISDMEKSKSFLKSTQLESINYRSGQF